jgi:hypothetical protein
MGEVKQRADLGFDLDDTGFNPAEWDVGTPAPKPPQRVDARKVAEATGFRSREVQPAPVSGAGGATASPPAKQLRRRRTGRNAQFNLKARPDTIESFCAVADAKGWGLGETLEYAVALLQREYGATRS